MGLTVGTDSPGVAGDADGGVSDSQRAEMAAAHASRVGAQRQARVQWTRSRRSVVRRALVASDLAALVAAYLLVQAEHPGQAAFGAGELGLAAVAILGWIPLAAVYGLYQGTRVRADNTTLDELGPILNAVTVGCWGVFLFTRLSAIEAPAGSRLVLFWLLAAIAVPAVRSATRVAMRSRVSYKQNVVIVGAGLVGQEIARKILRNPRFGFRLVGFVDEDPLPLHRDLGSVPVVGGPDELEEIAERYSVDTVMLAFTAAGHEAGLDVVRRCNELDLQVDIVPRLFEVVGSRAAFYSLQGTPMLGVTPPVLGTTSRLAKRAIDTAGAAFGLAVLSPLLLAVAAAIKLTSPGPVFFRQTRIGKGQRPFTIIKFRTMVVDAEERKAEVAHMNAHNELGDARMFKIPDDPRITRVGGFLRKYSIDELPQLINVLRGEMSLVGPRPLIPTEHQYVNDWGLRRLDLTPGLTGMWQVCGRSEVPFSQMLVLDYLYVTNWSLWGDIKLVFRTIPALFGNTRGAL